MEVAHHAMISSLPFIDLHNHICNASGWCHNPLFSTLQCHNHTWNAINIEGLALDKYMENITAYYLSWPDSTSMINLTLNNLQTWFSYFWQCPLLLYGLQYVRMFLFKYMSIFLLRCYNHYIWGWLMNRMYPFPCPDLIPHPWSTWHWISPKPDSATFGNCFYYSMVYNMFACSCLSTWVLSTDIAKLFCMHSCWDVTITIYEVD
jgi:hypothetical protein